MKIAFFMGSPDISGGSYVIFQHALYLCEQGHEVTIVVQVRWTPDQLLWHPAAQALQLVHVDDVGDQLFDVAVATWWKTAAALHLLRANQYAYFVQSIESRFYSPDEIPLRRLVDSTYSIGLPGITEATWIRDYLHDKCGLNYFLVKNGVRKDLYKPDGILAKPRLPRGQLRVLVEGPLGVFFKNVERTISLVRQSAPDEVSLLTSSSIGRHVYIDNVYSRVPIQRTPEIYRSCDVLVKLSYVEGMFGPPLEMFHCGGTAIVYDVTGHDEYIVHGKNALVAAKDDEAGVISLLRRLHREPEYLDYLKEGALATAQEWPDWTSSSEAFGNALASIMDQPRVSRDQVRAYNEEQRLRYEQAETARLKELPVQRVQQTLLSFAKRLPPGSQHRLKKIRDRFLSIRRK